MSDKSSFTNVPWAWAAVIEILAASPAVDVSVLLEVIEKAPDIPDDLGETMKERVALLCLEDLFGSSAGRGKDTCAASDAKIKIDPSKSCEDVLQDILHETSGSNLKGEGLELFKWDLNSFINEKKNSMPETSLQQLKETLLKAPCSYVAYLKEASGLEIFVDKGTRTVSESENKLPEIMVDGKLMPTKRLRAELAAENTEERCYENQSSMHGSDDLHPKVKKIRGASPHLHHGEGTPLPGRENKEDLSDRQDQVTTAEDCHLGKNDLGTLYEATVSSNTDDVHIVSQRPQQSDIGCEEIHHPDSECHSRLNIMPQDSSSSEPHQNKYRINGKDKDEHSGDPQDGTSQTVYTNDIRGSYGLQLEAQKTVLPDVLQQNNIREKETNDIKYYSDVDISSDSDEHYNERLNISEKKHEFLSSQCRFSDDTLPNTECTEQSICMKCKKEGNLLSCSEKDCIVVLHEKCVGGLVTFDAKGDFCCPFCTLAHAHRNHKRGKKEANEARSKLSAFICNRDEYGVEVCKNIGQERRKVI